MIKQETIRRFKDTVKKLMKKTDYNPSDSPFDILVLDIRKKEDRIEYCGYERDVKVQFGESLPFLGSPIKVIVRVPHKNRAVLTDDPDTKPVETGELQACERIELGEDKSRRSADGRDGSAHDVMDLHDLHQVGISRQIPASRHASVEKIKEVILDARLKDDLEQINTWGLIPIVDEIIPEIDGVPPETIQPNKAAYLEKIIDKISRTAILSEKGIH